MYSAILCAYSYATIERPWGYICGFGLWVWTPEWRYSKVMGESLALAKVGKGKRNTLDPKLNNAGLVVGPSQKY